MTYQERPPRPGRGRRDSGPGRPGIESAAFAGAGALVGIVTALVALGVAQLVAALLASPIGQPITAVGEMSINNTPASVKNFAIREFGSNDKTVLVWGIRVVLIIFAVAIGVLAIRRLWLGLIGLAVFAGVGLYATLSQPTAKADDVLPTLIGAAVSAFAMLYFSGVARGLLATAAPAQALPSAAPPSGEAPGRSARPGGPTEPAQSTEPAKPAQPRQPGQPVQRPDWVPGAAAWWPAETGLSDRDQGPAQAAASSWCPGPPSPASR